jgi:hypothetical protein
VNGAADRAGEPFRRRPEGITAPHRVVVPRPQRGWIAGLLSAGIMALGGLLALATALAVLMGVTVALWWVGDARIPVVVLVYWSAALTGGAFAVGRADRGSARHRRPYLPEGPGQIVWQRGLGRVRTGLVWERADAITSSPEAGGQKARPVSEEGAR